jgi:hypothetical protein
LGNPWEDKENLSLRAGVYLEEMRREEGKNEPVQRIVSKAPKVVLNTKKVQYDVQDVVIIMEDDALRRGRMRDLVQKKGKENVKYSPRENIKI